MESKIECPNCGHAFDVEDALSGKIKDHLRKEFETKAAEQARGLNDKKKALEQKERELVQAQKVQKEQFDQELKMSLDAERSKLEAETEAEYQKRYSGVVADLAKQKEANSKLKKQEIELLQRANELQSKEEELKFEFEKKLLEQQREIEEKGARKEREKFDLEKKQLQKKLDDAVKSAETLKRKAEQGSVQMQGEIQEIALENLLTQLYPFDRIDEVPKGVKGADCIQSVINKYQQECGRIVYESKRTQTFSAGWLVKLKTDMTLCKGDVPVLVTETMPKDMNQFGLMDGVWVCRFREVRGVSMLIREFLMKLQDERAAEENKGEKMAMLYTYLTSNEFTQNVSRISEYYGAMEEQLSKEKKAMNKLWKEREKQIYAVQENLGALFGSIKGIAGNALPSAADTILSLDSGEHD